MKTAKKLTAILLAVMTIAAITTTAYATDVWRIKSDAEMAGYPSVVVGRTPCRPVVIDPWGNDIYNGGCQCGGRGCGSCGYGRYSAPCAPCEPYRYAPPCPPCEPCRPAPCQQQAPAPVTDKDGEVLDHGTFTSYTGVGLNTRTEWKLIKDKDENKKLKVTVYVDHFALYTNQCDDVLVMTLDGNEKEKVSLPSPTITYGGKCLKSTYIGENTFDIDENAKSADLDISWAFNGKYSKQEIGLIKSHETIKIA